MARCVIVTGGDRGPVGPLNPDDCIIACDRGYTYCREAGVVPDLLLGDFDSWQGELPDGLSAVQPHPLLVEEHRGQAL